MKNLKLARHTVKDLHSKAIGETELDLATIRQRVAKIKRTWSPEIAQARALEGARRRRELDFLLTDYSDSEPAGDLHGLTLVG